MSAGLPRTVDMRAALVAAGRPVSRSAVEAWRTGARPMPVWAAWIIARGCAFPIAQLVAIVANRHLARRAVDATPVDG